MRRLARLADIREPAVAGAAAEHLERGDILYFPPGTVELPTPEEQRLLRDELPSAIRLKNISWHPHGGYLSGMKGAPELRRRTSAILAAHYERAVRVLSGHLRRYAGGWRPGKVNFRPLEEEGRKLSRHSSNEYLHVDAFASGATHGDRTLRFFTNLHPTEPRVWRNAGAFDALFAELGAAAGVAGKRVREALWDRAYSGLWRALASLLPPAILADTSPYDRLMRRFHNYLKDSDAFQSTPEQIRLEFPAGSSWAVMTDCTSHAVLRGRHALVATFHVRFADCVLPELAPLTILAAAADVDRQ